MSLRLRLLLTNLLVLVLGLLCAAVIGHGYKSRLFPARLSQLEQRTRDTMQSGRDAIDQEHFFRETLEIFNSINDRGTLLAIAGSLLVAGLLSFALIRAILSPLRRIEETARQFSSGNLSARAPLSNIPELRRFGLTLNVVADRLQQSEESRQALIGDVAHEMSTPLTVIRGYLELLQNSDEFQLTPEVKHQMHEESLRLSRLLEDLRTLSTVEAGAVSLQMESFPPCPVIRQAVAAFRAKGWFNECELILECPERLPKIFADRDRFTQIITNLISNALAYTPQGSVTVRAWAEQNYLWISVSDTGIGISPDDLPLVFDRFWRSDHSRHLRSSGSGIGLAITKRLVEIMSGRIEVESELGVGTTFKFCLSLDSR